MALTPQHRKSGTNLSESRLCYIRGSNTQQKPMRRREVEKQSELSSHPRRGVNPFLELYRYCINLRKDTGEFCSFSFNNKKCIIKYEDNSGGGRKKINTGKQWQISQLLPVPTVYGFFPFLFEMRSTIFTALATTGGQKLLFLLKKKKNKIFLLFTLCCLFLQETKSAENFKYFCFKWQYQYR